MVVLAILGIVVVGVLGLVTRQNKAYHSEEAIIDMQMNNRVAMDRIVYFIRMAGFGCRGNISATNPITVNASTSFNTVITATNNSTSSDTLTIISGLRRVGVVTDINDADGDGNDTSNEKFPPSTTIQVTMDPNAPDFDDGSTYPYKRYFYVSPASSRNFLTIANGGVNNSTNTILTKEGGSIIVYEGNIVYTVRPYTIRLYTDSQGISCLGIDDGSGIKSFAENIEDLQFQYGWDQDGDGQFDPNSEWADDPSGNEDQVRAVKIYLLARSTHPDRDFTDLHDDDAATAGKQYTIADHTITLDSDETNGFNSAFDHHYHRYLVETTVLIRNLNL